MAAQEDTAAVAVVAAATAAAATAKRKTVTDRIGWRGFLKFLFVVAALVLFGAVYFKNFGDDTQLKYTIVFLIGGLLGLTEILGRYTDSPMAAIKSPGALIYVLVNAFGSVAALYLLAEFAPNAVSSAVSQVLLAGVGAMAFLRSSVFKAKVGTEEVSIGPAIILDTLLKFADAQVDRGRAEDRAAGIAEVIQSLPLAQAAVDLPRLCFALMQNLQLDVRQRVLDDITLVVTDTKRSEQVKVMEVGLVLWSRVGIGTLTGAITLLQNKVAMAQLSQQPAHPIVPPRPQGSPQDLLPEIERQLALDRQAGV
jgi:hypothetical protein